MRYTTLYNHQFPQSALKSKTPIRAMRDWYKTHPHLFHKKPYFRPGRAKCHQRYLRKSSPASSQVNATLAFGRRTNTPAKRVTGVYSGLASHWA